jgi:hypothetical protein
MYREFDGLDVGVQRAAVAQVFAGLVESHQVTQAFVDARMEAGVDLVSEGTVTFDKLARMVAGDAGLPVEAVQAQFAKLDEDRDGVVGVEAVREAVRGLLTLEGDEVAFEQWEQVVTDECDGKVHLGQYAAWVAGGDAAFTDGQRRYFGLLGLELRAYNKRGAVFDNIPL